ncbi:MAG: hypothetical protein OEM25_00040 [Gammaproteobacteria bacterium]|nr:hypothetical protein [Gammaproteobacteria bacterium]
MGVQTSKLTLMVVGLVATTLAGISPSAAIAQSQPREVRDLIAAHDALAMRVRPLQDRIIVAEQTKRSDEGFQPRGVPETIGHKGRAVSDSDDYGRIKVRLSTLENKARTERRRISRPGFGTVSDGKEIADARKTLVGLQKELVVLEREVNALRRR